MSAEWRTTDESVYPGGDNPFHNNFFGYRSTGLELPGGKLATYYGVIIPPCVHIVTLDDQKQTHLVRQSRPNAKQVGLSLPIPVTLELAGGFASQDDLEGSARKELAEELGLTASSLEQVGQIHPSPGVSNEIDTIYLATGLKQIPNPIGSGEETEQDLRIVSGNFGDMYRRVIEQAAHTPQAAQTIAAMAMVAVRL